MSNWISIETFLQMYFGYQDESGAEQPCVRSSTPPFKAVQSVRLRKPDDDMADNDHLAIMCCLCKGNYLYTVLKHTDQELDCAY